MKRTVIPIMWLLLAAVIIGAALGLSAIAHADPYNPYWIINPPPTSTPCVLIAGQHWLCPNGVTPPAAVTLR